MNVFVDCGMNRFLAGDLVGRVYFLELIGVEIARVKCSSQKFMVKRHTNT